VPVGFVDITRSEGSGTCVIRSLRPMETGSSSLVIRRTLQGMSVSPDTRNRQKE
jgi:hypothetical protein